MDGSGERGIVRPWKRGGGFRWRWRAYGPGAFRRREVAETHHTQPKEDTMAELGIAERSLASRNAMLSAKVCRAIRSVMKNRDLSQREQAILIRGADLLSNIIEGSLLIGGKQAEEIYSRADLRAFSHAVTALEGLSNVSDDADLTKEFSLYREELESLSKTGDGLGRERLDQLWGFFKGLNQLFYRDIQKSSAPDRDQPFLAGAFS